MRTLGQWLKRLTPKITNPKRKQEENSISFQSKGIKQISSVQKTRWENHYEHGGVDIAAHHTFNTSEIGNSCIKNDTFNKMATNSVFDWFVCALPTDSDFFFSSIFTIHQYCNLCLDETKEPIAVQHGSVYTIDEKKTAENREW